MSDPRIEENWKRHGPNASKPLWEHAVNWIAGFIFLALVFGLWLLVALSPFSDRLP